MNFQDQLRKNFSTFSTRLIFIILALFLTITLIVNVVERNIDKNESIEFLRNTFDELNFKIILQMENHNSNLEYLNAIEDKTIDKKIVSINNYKFSQKMNLRYNYNIYDMNLIPIYEEIRLSSLRFDMYMNIIKDRILNEDSNKFIMFSDLENENSYIIYYSGLYKNNNLIAIDTFIIDINNLSYYLLPKSGDYIITNKHGTIIASNNHEFIHSNESFKYTDNFRINGIRYNITDIYTENYNIYYLEQSFNLQTYYYVLFIILIIILILVIYFSNEVIKRIAKKNSQSIESIINDTNIVSQGKLDHKIDEQLDDEFKDLSKNINQMINRLNSEIELNKELSEINLIYEKKKLDSQFNPHFLYNSLETIRYSMLFDVKETEKYILELNSILRYSINNNINYSTLKDDLTYLKKYLILYKFRFKDKFTYSISIDKKMEDILVPKLSIQPLVGNSIKYGFENNTKVQIEINAEMKDDVCYIKVYDNGVSISDKIIKEIKVNVNKKKNITNHIGLHNVLRRFMILYPNSNLDVRRNDMGTVFEISFKIEESNNV